MSGDTINRHYLFIIVETRNSFAKRSSILSVVLVACENDCYVPTSMFDQREFMMPIYRVMCELK